LNNKLQNKGNSIFGPAYWSTAAAEFRKPRTLVFAALTIALGIVMNLFNIPVSENLHVSVAFLPVTLGSMVFGPVVGLSAGVVYDLVGFMVMPSGMFFPGYTLSSMLEFFIYGVFLYRRKLSVVRILAAKFTVNYLIHVGFGSLWSAVLYGKAYYYYFWKGLIKNTILLPVEVLLLVALFQAFFPFLVREGLIPKQERKMIPFL